MTFKRKISWQPTPFVTGSVIIHVGALTVAMLAHWRIALTMLLFNQAVIVTAGLLPRCRLLGQNIVRLPLASVLRAEVALTFDDGPDPEVTPHILAILASHKIHATFFCIGEKAAAYPDICRSIVSMGHKVENHGQNHRNALSLSGMNGWRREIGTAQTTLKEITGVRPKFFRPIAGLRNPFLDPVLHEYGVTLASWSQRGYDTRCKDADKVYSRLTKNLKAGDILLLHDGNSAKNPSGIPIIYDVLPRLLNELAARNLKPVPLNIS